jgi:S-DNA-T family DNA segregation ATPase FtsK/SpoIIIE
MIISLIYKNSPKDLKLLLIDTKMLDFSIYSAIPHLLTKIIKNKTDALTNLRELYREIDSRYGKLNSLRAKDIDSYNIKANLGGFKTLPQIVIIIDEFADIISSESENILTKIAQTSKSVGIYIIISTKIPSYDIVTSNIKSSFSSRIIFKVNQKNDSKILLDQSGAETLVSRGDALFLSDIQLQRIHTAIVSDGELDRISKAINIKKS